MMKILTALLVVGNLEDTAIIERVLIEFGSWIGGLEQVREEYRDLRVVRINYKVQLMCNFNLCKTFRIPGLIILPLRDGVMRDIII